MAQLFLSANYSQLETWPFVSTLFPKKNFFQTVFIENEVQFWRRYLNIVILKLFFHVAQLQIKHARFTFATVSNTW